MNDDLWAVSILVGTTWRIDFKTLSFFKKDAISSFNSRRPQCYEFAPLKKLGEAKAVRVRILPVEGGE